MVELEIDGQAISIAEGASIIEAADNAGIYIPRFCYHKKLSIAANCRMCLVEVEGSRKALPACATPVTAGMKVFTTSKIALESQRIVMQFLLANHPLDCPICDQGGQCELQDLAMGYGGSYSYYNEGKRAVFSEDIGPLIETEMTRCIQCTRCVRFGEEIAGMRELGAINRGEKEAIVTFVKHVMESELSGNVADICPVGALTEKPSRFHSRGWEVKEHASIAAHDCVGSNIYIHSFFKEYEPQRNIMKVVPRENSDINEVWICDRDRFSYEGLRHNERVAKPLMRKNGEWLEVDWRRALLEIADRTLAITQEQGPDKIAALASPNSTTEELYLLQKLMRGLGCHNVDHRLREQDFSSQKLVPEFPNLGMAIKDIESLNTVLLVGTDLRTEASLIGHRINKAAQDGADVYLINPMSYRTKFEPAGEMIDGNIAHSLAGIAKALSDAKGESIPALKDVVVSDMAKQAADKLLASDNKALFIGAHSLHHPQQSHIIKMCRLIAQLSNVTLGAITDGANSCGAWLAGFVPHRAEAFNAIEQPGLHARELLTDKAVRGYFLLNTEPEFDSAYSASALEALNQAGLVVCMSTHVSENMKDYADFILPVAAFAETSGTFVNAEGTWQSFAAATLPADDIRPGWKVIRALANFLNIDGFDYQDVHQVSDELQAKVATMSAYKPATVVVEQLPAAASGLRRFAPWHMYRSDNLVRRAVSLQKTLKPSDVAARVNKATAEKHNLLNAETVRVKQNNQELQLALYIDDALADDLVLLPSGLEQTAGFGQVMQPITIERAAQ